MAPRVRVKREESDLTSTTSSTTTTFISTEKYEGKNLVMLYYIAFLLISIPTKQMFLIIDFYLLKKLYKRILYCVFLKNRKYVANVLNPCVIRGYTNKKVRV